VITPDNLPATGQPAPPQSGMLHDQGYRHYGGLRAPHGQAWMVIARMHVMNALKYRPFLMLLLVAWARVIYYGVRIYVASVSAQVPTFFAVNPGLWQEFLTGQGTFVFLVTIAQAGIIADDRRANALQLYLSKPLTRLEYVIGKLVPPMLWLLGVTWVPAMLLLILQVVLSGSLAFLRENLFLLPAITLASFVDALLSTFLILALSSMSKSRRFVSVMFAGIMFFTFGMYQSLRAITGSRMWAAISPGSMVDVITAWVFRARTEPLVPVPVAVAVVVGLIVLSVVILERRVRGVEVVA
jgi:ABC-2 type transport system permease protein